jgi:CBS domain-containing protein
MRYENIRIAHIDCGEVNTAITKRAIELSVLKMEKEPCPICMVKYSSQGRKNKLLTDQDNALFFKM